MSGYGARERGYAGTRVRGRRSDTFEILPVVAGVLIGLDMPMSSRVLGDV